MRDLDETTFIYNIVCIILTIGLITSELLAWSSCDANGITQLYKIFKCVKTVASQTQSILSINPNVQMDNWSDTSSAPYQSTVETVESGPE